MPSKNFVEVYKASKLSRDGLAFFFRSGDALNERGGTMPFIS
jgi:hypothetical protein